jgi:hypothetical protein
MNKTRLPIFVVSVSLILTSVFAVQAYQRTVGARPSSGQKAAGMGDLQRFEAQQAAEAAAGQASSSAKTVGMGDLRLYEAQQAGASSAAIIPQTGRPACSSLSTAAGERDAGASAPAYVLRAMGCQVP